MDRNLALEFVRVTESAAIAAAAWMGKGDKISADKAAVDEMRSRFNQIDFDGIVKIGEGEKDEAPMLYTGEKIGTGKGPAMDVALDPVEGTTNLSLGLPNSISVVATGPRDHLLSMPGTYTEQLCVGPEAKEVIDIKASVKVNIHNIAKALGKPVDEVTVVILNRPRHEAMIKEIRDTGARISLIEHGTVAAGVAAAMPNSGVDVMMGTGGAPEAVITAVGVKCFGGNMQALLKPHKDKFLEDARKMGFHDLNKVLTMEDLAKGNNVTFAATGITSGPLLKGVVFGRNTVTTHSVVMRARTRTIRYIEAIHNIGDMK
ncbi:MAG TPA: class II fructose-bisphosphatase [Candidatus Nanoarchaeia archaeon]|nr:class II fructose-bisphosphatase [Candidatus Nanoarchaeia archaeon]